MKKSLIKIILSVLFFFFTSELIAQLGIKESKLAPHPKAMLDVESTSKGVLLPRMTTAQRNAISPTVAGLMIYNSTDNKYNYFNGSNWSEFVLGGFTLPFSASTDLSTNAFSISNTNTNTGSAAIFGYNHSGRGVYGFAETGNGVRGESYGGIGVYGASLDVTSSQAVGIKGVNFSNDGVGVLAVNNAENPDQGTALEIAGSVKVSSVRKFAFTHFATVANRISANGTDINNILCNGDPNALLFVTQRINSTGTVYNNSPIAVNYNATRAKWEIVNLNGAAIAINAQFNVMVIKQ
jgi:hypothetical protein